MKHNETTIGRDLLKALLGHPGTVIVIGEDDRIRLAYAEEFEAANSQS